MNASTHTSKSRSQPENKARCFLLIARGGWLAVAGLCLFLLTIAIPVRSTQLANPSPQIRAGLSALGLPLWLYVLSNLLFESCVMFGFFMAATLLFWRRSNEWFPLLVAFLLVTFGTAGPTLVTLQEANPTWIPLTGLIDIVSWGLLGLFLSLFPDGRFVPRWSLWYNIVMIVYSLLWDIPTLPEAFHPSNWPLLLFLFFQLGPFALFLGFQIYRYRYVSGPVQRLQARWLLLGVGVVLCTIPFVLLTITPSRTPATIFGLFLIPSLRLLWLSIPLSLAIAILRYRLWDIDLIINRAIVYGSLTASIVGLYTLTVVILGTFLRTQGNFLISLLATGLIAVLFHPLRERLQRGVNRMLYGQRDEPYSVISQLGSSLEAALAPERVLPTIVETTAHALKLPYVAIILKQQETSAITASYGEIRAANDELIHFPLIYQTEKVGELLIASRTPGESLTSADQRLLETLARQAGAAAYGVRLTIDLQRLATELQQARTQLVTTREEERRRLRRDLHDGLGPALASLTFKVDAARNLLTQDRERVDRLLIEVREQAQEAIADIRHLVYNLRPPTLDELGLLSALREHAVHYQQQGLTVTLEAPSSLPPLPAAVEVAAYRIAQEALTNVVRHAQAQHCMLRFSTTAEALQLEISDDGKGISGEHRVGVGLHAMRERASELGGTCSITPNICKGTIIQVCLPLGGAWDGPFIFSQEISPTTETDKYP